jgi:hypothetical protein
VLARRDAASPITADHPVFRKVAGLGHPNLLDTPVVERQDETLPQYIGVDEVPLRNSRP